MVEKRGALVGGSGLQHRLESTELVEPDFDGV